MLKILSYNLESEAAGKAILDTRMCGGFISIFYCFYECFQTEQSVRAFVDFKDHYRDLLAEALR